MSALNTSQFVLYVILFLPVLYILYRHKTAGILGWLYLTAFVTIRVAGLGMQLDNNGSTSSSAVLLNNIGLSPLLLSALGLLHEARRAHLSIVNNKLEWALIIIYHIFVTTGLAILASGISSMTSSHPPSSAASMAKVGYALMLIAWIILAIYTLISLPSRQTYPAAPKYDFGSKVGNT
ncbi:hypothetical protein BGW36DRAFT_357402 [Talaromyces proteolyticus]|uniref:DUF7702 domain-containing protein n=1 Tax=Talaromyces proteolyticus TaxID=1131652 RepID=A0AAD4L0Q2_9EURO|nr:uncharacterized protein BGW36DRAFT_357402 [Talaromyces proteolyticus]KAH8700754.1 hypothetical protein BGW36DRAFT_357402 [Talaromyces proteolyticus]